MLRRRVFFHNAALVVSFFTSLFSAPGLAQQALTPAAVPLAVRSPYLSCWESMANGTHPPNSWPTTWEDPSPQILGWQGYARVDDITYSFLGDFPDNKIIMNISQTTITPTRTTWTMPAGPMEINVTFFSPIEPRDPIKQSIPFSYMYFEAVSTDGAEHSVQVYSDISAEWSSGNRSEVVQWSTVAGSNSIFHQVFLSEQTTFKEIDQQAEWGTLYFSTKVNSLVTYKIASDKSCRDEFHDKGKLDFGEDTQFRGIASSFPVYAIATDLGVITSTQGSPVVWAIGYARDPAVSYLNLTGVPQNRSLYYQSKYSDAGSLINDFLDDFSNAKNRADQLDAKILDAANNLSSDYADLVSLAARQVFGATELTISKGADGNWDTSDVMMFMKNIGESSRNRVNAVEVLYQAFPLFMFVDPTLGGPLLEPLLRFQNSTNYTNPYAAQDIGSSYPVALASNHTHNEGVEQSANMLIMTYAHARATGNGSLAYRYYNLFSRWTDFLIDGALYPTNQASSDTGDATNFTNLAIKGIVAIKAMSELSKALGRVDDAQQYAANATQLVQQWTSQALSSDKSRLLETYGDASSTTLGYNLFADRWLGTQLVDQSVYDAQTGFFAQLFSGNTFGLPTDSSDPGHASSSWNLFAAAIATNTTVRDSMISKVRARASFNQSTGAFPVVYEPLSGKSTSGVASPAQGAMFAPLALTVASIPISVKPQDDDSAGQSNHHTNAGVVAGGVIAGVAGLGLAAALTVFLRWRHRGRGKLDIVERGSTPSPIEPFDGRDMSEYRAPDFGGIWRSRSSMSSSSPEALSPPDSLQMHSEIHSFVLPPPEPAIVGLAGKELAQYRADLSAAPVDRSDASGSSYYGNVGPDTHPSAPILPTSKELAQLRSMNAAAASSSSSGPPQFTDPFTDNVSMSTGTSSQPPTSVSSATQPSVGTHGPRPSVSSAGTGSDVASQLRNEVEGLRREMEQIRQERLEPPPSYF